VCAGAGTAEEPGEGSDIGVQITSALGAIPRGWGVYLAKSDGGGEDSRSRARAAGVWRQRSSSPFTSPGHVRPSPLQPRAAAPRTLHCAGQLAPSENAPWQLVLPSAGTDSQFASWVFGICCP